MLSTILLVLAAIALSTAYFVFGHRRPSVDLVADPASLPPIRESLPLLAGLTDGEPDSGNAVTVHQNGGLITEMMTAIEGAQSTVHFETYVWATGKLEEKFLALLSRKAQEGLTVRVLIDAVGGQKADKRRIKDACRTGVEVAFYRPFGSSTIRRFNHRNHRKLLIVDGKAAYVFGHGISDEWMGAAEDGQHWRDTGVGIRGPGVNHLQTIFFKDWIASTGRIPSEPDCFHRGEAQGNAIVHSASSTGDSQSSASLLYKLAIIVAEREIVIQNPYFVPGAQVVNLLNDAVRRGVAVHLMVPGKNTDSRIARRAGCRLYRSLLEAGVKLYEYERTLLHQKVVVVDGVWSHVGSTNFDQRSFALNAEIGVGILDEEVARQLKAAFEDDLSCCHPISLETWLQRPWRKRCIDWFAHQMNSQL